MKPQTVREYLDRLNKGLLDTSAGGQLGTAQQNKFLGTMIEAWPILNSIRVIRGLKDPNFELNELDIADRQMYAPTAGTEPSAGELADFTISARTLTVKEATIPANVSKNFLLRNIEGQDVEATLNGKLASALGGNILDLAINGDGATAGFLAINKGWLTLAAEDSTVNDVDTNASEDFLGTVFPACVQAMPAKAAFSEMHRPEFFMNWSDLQKYRAQLRARATGLGDSAITTGAPNLFDGFKINALPYMPAGSILFTPPQNLVVGFWEEMSLYRAYNPRKHQLEFTLDTQHDPNYESGWRIVYARQIA